MADAEQRHTASLFGSLRLSPSVHASARYSYGSNFPIPGFLRLENGRYNLGARRNELQLPAYHRLDLRLNKGFHIEVGDGWTWRGTLYVEAMNMAKHRNFAFDAFHGFHAQTAEAWPGLLRLFPVVPAAGLMIEWERGLRRC